MMLALVTSSMSATWLPMAVEFEPIESEVCLESEFVECLSNEVIGIRSRERKYPPRSSLIGSYRQTAPPNIVCLASVYGTTRMSARLRC